MSRLYGFWHYDLFPYCVGGYLGEPVKGAPGYFDWANTGCVVKPFLVMSEEDGRITQDKLAILKIELFDEENKLRDRMNRKLAKVISIPKRGHT